MDDHCDFKQQINAWTARRSTSNATVVDIYQKPDFVNIVKQQNITNILDRPISTYTKYKTRNMKLVYYEMFFIIQIIIVTLWHGM
jgi:hypothetical protein